MEQRGAISGPQRYASLVRHDLALEAYVDAMNILALRTTTAVTTNDGPLFGQTSARMPSMRLRLGMRYRF